MVVQFKIGSSFLCSYWKRLFGYKVYKNYCLITKINRSLVALLQGFLIIFVNDETTPGNYFCEWISVLSVHLWTYTAASLSSLSHLACHWWRKHQTALSFPTILDSVSIAVLHSGLLHHCVSALQMASYFMILNNTSISSNLLLKIFSLI